MRACIGCRAIVEKKPQSVTTCRLKPSLKKNMYMYAGLKPGTSAPESGALQWATTSLQEPPQLHIFRCLLILASWACIRGDISDLKLSWKLEAFQQTPSLRVTIELKVPRKVSSTKPGFTHTPSWSGSKFWGKLEASENSEDISSALTVTDGGLRIYFLAEVVFFGVAILSWVWQVWVRQKNSVLQS